MTSEKGPRQIPSSLTKLRWSNSLRVMCASCEQTTHTQKEWRTYVMSQASDRNSLNTERISSSDTYGVSSSGESDGRMRNSCGTHCHVSRTLTRRRWKEAEGGDNLDGHVFSAVDGRVDDGKG